MDPDRRPAGAGGAADAATDEVAEARVAAVVESTSRFVRATFPHVEPEPFATLSCLYTTTPDHDYILDEVPGWAGVVVAGGGSGHAFKMGPAIGDAAAALALGLEPPFSLETVRLDRPALRRA